jgi:hypothetical protein
LIIRLKNGIDFIYGGEFTMAILGSHTCLIYQYRHPKSRNGIIQTPSMLPAGEKNATAYSHSLQLPTMKAHCVETKATDGGPTKGEILP